MEEWKQGQNNGMIKKLKVGFDFFFSLYFHLNFVVLFWMWLNCLLFRTEKEERTVGVGARRTWFN